SGFWSRFFRLFLPAKGNWLPQVVAIASLILAFGMGAWALSLRSQYAALQKELVAQRQELILQREVIARVASPLSKSIPISGTEKQPAAHGDLIANTQTGSAVLLVSGLSRLEAGNTYELWLIKGNTPIPAGLFQVDEAGNGLLRVSEIVMPGAYDAIGVSIEPAAGSLQPTGDIVMLSEIN
ncbi:MAG TPA: anti-sigma factor, partial [Anaerolineales bacterium]